MIRFSEPYLTGRELEYLAAVISNRTFSGLGPFSQRCAELLSGIYGGSLVLMTHSCTGALEMAALMLDFEPGDEVIIPSYTFCTTASSFLRAGAQVVFCEIDPATMMIDVNDAASRMTARTKAIVPVHYGGAACRIADILSLAEGRGIGVVEDAAQALDVFASDRPLGSSGRFGCLSFHETKNIHCGYGGAIIANRHEDHERVRHIWERGTNRQQLIDGVVDKYTWVDVGSSFALSELQCAFLLAQLETREHNTQLRGQIWHRYREGLDPEIRSGRIRVLEPGLHVRQNYHAFCVILADLGDRERARRCLNGKGVAAQFHYLPLHSSPVGAKLGYKPEDLPVTERLSERLLRLPLHASMSIEDVDYACKAFRECLHARSGQD